ncbi:zinc finger protein 732-like [Leguminivora glycinivorella]|uniref:zinc finger protein 732-like n=1 Tax=Leguminivora glycinivorella TaxID=1035111 RepID=UPI002010205A|nr:zinc finger protein 732-like [Leguminivora glycinivorella]
MEANGSCCCCLLRPPVRGMSTPYVRLGVTEIYSEMLADCFDIRAIIGNNESGICTACVDRLLDASDFKKQVQCSQAKLQERADALLDIKGEEIKLEITEGNDISGGLILYEPPKLEVEDDANDYDTLFTYDDNKNCAPYEPEPPLSAEMAWTSYSDSFEPSSYDGASADQETTSRRPILITRANQSHANSRKKTHTKENTSRVCKKQVTRDAHQYEKENETIYPLRSKVKFEHKPKPNNDYTNIYATGPYTCNICYVVMTTRRSMACHMAIHTEPKSEICENNTWDCDKCDKIFSTKNAMNSHMRNVHSKKTFRCDVCSKLFNSLRQMTKHKVIHTERERNYCCDQCGQRFLTNTVLACHKQCHTGDKPFTCDICQKKFRNKYSMKEHVYTHMGFMRYTCNKCGKKFTTSSGCRKHDLSHHKNTITERAFSCEICNKQFMHNHHLKRHKLLHTGEKPYECETCGKQFSVKFNLDTHMQTHVKGTYSCDVCSKTYATKESLRQHKRVHSRDKVKKSE